MWLNPLPNDKILDVTELKEFADDKLNIAEMMISLFDRAENTVGKGENSGNQHFLLFPQFFPKPSSLGSLNYWLLAVLRFNATLTAKVVSWQSVTHMFFLAFSHQY